MVLTGLAVVSVPWPPTSLSFGPSVPVGPWHIAHLAAKTWAPCFTVPCPEGRPSPVGDTSMFQARSEEHTSELQSQSNLVCRLLLEKKKHTTTNQHNLKRMMR